MIKRIIRKFFKLKKIAEGKPNHESAESIAVKAMQSYGYLENLVFKNSLKKGGIPLCVSSKEESYLKKAGAVFCSREKGWFCPMNQKANFEELSRFFPKAFQAGKNILVPNLIPEPLWGANLRKYLSKSDWDALRKHTYESSGYRCSICGGQGERWPVECHELWDYRSFDESCHISVLIGLKSLCPKCHQVNHLGKARVDGVYEETLAHMAGINQWSIKEAEQVSDRAFDLWKERSEKRWLLGYDDEIGWDPSIQKILASFFCEKKGLK